MNNMSQEYRDLIAYLLIGVFLLAPLVINYMAKRHRPVKRYRYTSLEHGYGYRNRRKLNIFEKILAHLRII